MMLDDILTSLFGNAHGLKTDHPIVTGKAAIPSGDYIHVLGFTHRTDLGVDDAVALARRVLEIAASPDGAPILFLVDTGSQRMSRRDELMGLNETLAHLAKSLFHAGRAGHRTVGLLYGGSTAGAFIATALSCGTLVALPGADPAVMDLPSMAKVTKLSLEVLQAKAAVSPVFAPGLGNLERTGAIAEVWDPSRPLGDQLRDLLSNLATDDERSELGRSRGGRMKAGEIAAKVVALAVAHG